AFVWSHLIFTPSRAGILCGSALALTIFHDQCMRYARLGGLKVAAIETDAPAARSAARNESTFSLNGEIRSAVLVLVGHWAHDAAPLSRLHGLATALGTLFATGVRFRCCLIGGACVGLSCCV